MSESVPRRPFRPHEIDESASDKSIKRARVPVWISDGPQPDDVCNEYVFEVPVLALVSTHLFYCL